MGDEDCEAADTGALSVFRTMFAQVILLGRLKQPGPPGPRGLQGCKGPDGPLPEVTRDAGGGTDAQICALVRSEYAAFTSGIQSQFWEELAPPPCDPFESFHTAAGAAQEYGEWRTNIALPVALSEHLQLQLCCADDPLLVDVALVARQVRTLTHKTAATDVARTICSVGGDYTKLYLVTTVEQVNDAPFVFVFKTEVLSPGGQRESVYTAPIEQYFIDSTARYSKSGAHAYPSPARAVLSSLDPEGVPYEDTNSDSNRELAKTIHELFTRITQTAHPTLRIAVIGIRKKDNKYYEALVLPFLLQEDAQVAFAQPYIHGSSHTGPAVVVVSHEEGVVQKITKIESLTRTIILQKPEK